MTEPPVHNERWLRIKALFPCAVEQPPEALGAWLDAACGDDGELRQDLESLLASHQSASTFMQAPAIAAPGAASAVTERVAPGIRAAMVDRRLGPYRLISELGRGGMGVVYLAERDDQAFDRQVAVKMVHGGLLHPSLVDRFETERRILARFEHPNIARLIDAGTDDTGTPYAVMEYVRGTPIDAYARDRSLSTVSRLELFCAVCDAVQYSHERLVVHRDIKPGNVLVTEDGVPKLLDFGIAKLLDPAGGATDRTRSDLRALTPESASPEQVRGDPITVATDVYSLGVLLFRLLTDASPYGNTVRTDLEMGRAICEEEAVRPSEVVGQRSTGLSPRAAVARRRELKGDLDLITLKALRKDPNRRYQSVEGLALDLRRHLAAQPVEAAPDSRRYRAAKFLRRHRVGVGLTAAIAVTTAGGVVATVVQARVAQIERERAERRFNEVRGLARSMIFEVYDAIRPLAGSTAARELLLRRTLGYLDRLVSEPGADASLQRELAEAYTRIGTVQGHGGTANLGQHAAAVESYRKALAIRERLAQAGGSDWKAQADLALLLRDFGVVLWAAGDVPNALQRSRASVSLYERLLASRQPDVSLQSEAALSYLALSDVELMLDGRQPALSLVQKALPLSRAAADAAPNNLRVQRILASTYRKVGALEIAQNYYARGLEAFGNALAIDERRLSAAPNSADTRMDVSIDVGEIARALLTLGDPRGALAHAERARGIRADLAGADPRDVRAKLALVRAIRVVALTRWRLGAHARALAEHRSALLHLDALAALTPGDENVEYLRAQELGDLAVGYIQVDTGHSSRDACRRARPFLVRALDTYRDLTAKDWLPGDMTPTLADLQRALQDCGAGR